MSADAYWLACLLGTVLLMLPPVLSAVYRLLFLSSDYDADSR